MMKFHVFFTLFISVIIVHTGSSSDLSPKITYNRKEFLDYPGGALVVKSGSSFNLRCEGSTQVKWKLPIHHMVFGTSETETVVTSNETIQYDNMRPYVASISLEEASYFDTGLYSCITSAATSDTDPDQTASVHVYIKDDEELLTEISNVGQASQYKDFLIPCRPTSPEVNVTLWRDDHRIDNESEQSFGSVMTVTYKSSEGFMLHQLNLINGGLYECKAVLPGNDETFERMINIHVLAQTEEVPKPTINGTDLHKVEGSRLVLECSIVMSADINFSLNWTVPNNQAVESKRVTISKAKLRREIDSTGITKQFSSCLLTIKKTLLSDSGEYVCVVKDHTQKTNSAKITLNVFGAHVRYINMTEQIPINVSSGTREVQWVVPIAAYPSVNLTWLSPDDLEVVTRDRFMMTVLDREVKLVIRNPTLRDAGVYKLRAVNNVQEKNLSLSLFVKAKPTVTLITHDDEYYKLRGTYSLKCKVIGYPIAVVKWLFKRCDHPPSCDNNWDLIDTSTVTEREEKGFKLVSTLLKEADLSGYIACVANNSEGSEEKLTTFWVTDVSNGFSVGGPSVIVEGDNVTLECGVSKYNYTSNLVWYFTYNGSSTSMLINNAPKYTVESLSTQFSYRSKLTLSSVSVKHSGVYSCQANTTSGFIEKKSYSAEVKIVTAPTIDKSNMNGTELLVETGVLVQWLCDARGVPEPTITWYKDTALVDCNNSSLYELKDSNRTLVIQVSKPATEGTYECRVHNKAGQISRSMTLKLKDKLTTPIGVIVAVVIISIVLGLLIIFLVFKIRKEQKLRKELRMIGLDQFDKGALENINPELPIDDQAELLPYDRKWEFPRDKLKLGKQLGAGAFGVVMKADAIGITEGEAISTVAVKMVKRNADYTYIKALASELKIMVHLGKHLNVVNLLGACTKNLMKRELFVIVEYCRFGNLHNYLLRHRSNFIDQVDPTSGLIDPNLGADIIARHEALSYKASDSSDGSGMSSPGDYRAIGQSSSGVDSDQAFISFAPTGGEEGMMLSNNSIQPEWRSNYRGDYKGNVRPICTRDLVCYAFQVARGMEYLANRKVMHGDLAARNILLSEDNIVKICDFGLAKSMYKSDNYRKKGDGPLPVKWMAVESIQDRVFSTQSDVWSYGIVLWEFFSLSRTPYPGMEADEKLYSKLKEGYRMDKPEFATNEIYEIMENCWLAKPTERPTFNDLASQFGNMLEDSVRCHYIDLNEPYINMNEHWKDGQASDYLAMMTAPTYDNMLAPGAVSVEDVHEYVNGSIHANSDRPASDPNFGETSGYLCMKSPQIKETNIFSPRVPASTNPFNFSPQERRFEDELTKEDETRPMLSNNDYKSPNILSRPVNNLNKDTSFSRIRNEEPIANITPSFSNPSYLSMGPISPTPDNYINMPQQKLAGVKGEENENPISFNDTNYVGMGKPFDASNQNSISFTKTKDGEAYVNIPNHGHKVSDVSSGFQSDLSENLFAS